MPRFRTQPLTAEAYEWTGNPTDVPLAFAQMVATDPPPVGYWLVQMPTLPLEVVSPAAMDVRFNEIIEEMPVDFTGASTVTYVGNPMDPQSTPDRMEWMGHRFILGVPTPVSDPDALVLFRKNRFFVVTEPASVPTPDEVVVDTPPPARRGPGRPPRASYLQPMSDAEASIAQEGANYA